jgi:hypothetical protein
MDTSSAIPVTTYDKNVVLISGYDINIMNSLFKGELKPIVMMLDELNVERYNIL